jgi:hypothetical protein
MILIYSKDVDDFVNNVIDCLDVDFVRIGESEKVVIETMDFSNENSSYTLKTEYLENIELEKIQSVWFNGGCINSGSSDYENKCYEVLNDAFILPYYEGFNLEELNKLLSENSRIHSIIIFNSPYDKSYESLRQKMGYIMLVKKNIINEKHCGIINEEYFYSNIKLFSESQHHNTCLNKKLSIDKDGNIKNSLNA